ncbi:type IV pilus biogenesis/stability protein PilW [Sansalvadorimonas sp. 2012CJ34-2]|uniref:Type IV pilus biogenesis/stability protein PilW n=1 Tax=Parendozoicomonas callyspongiae TaxID=2942213 RepID=A0ABT0PCJ2_9GAMM|nr:type IV pilus biogenesis/stability protein PilW [Sansalvadorimonas sp. 2012CJ34-2]MCL6269018.1 type IV pilus biogenesis/stability protein PilW [Sansalvadorimonas sp. 2012CJ34-2]
MKTCKRNALLLAVILTLLSGCVSTLPDKKKIKDPVVYEQKNLEIAHGFLQKGYPARAISRLEEILKVNKNSARAYGMLGVVYQAQGEYTLAEKNFKRSLRIDSDASDVRNNYGVLLYELDRHKEARIQFEKVTEDIYYEQRSRTFENLGFVALKVKDVKEAEKNFQRALRLDNNLPRASLEMAQLSLDKRNYVDAERYYKNYQNLARSGRPTARSLWLGIQIAQALRDREALDENADKLTRLYPGSQEYRKYQASLRNE